MTTKQKQQGASRLIAEYQPRLRAFIRKRVPNKEDADDILQEVFYQLVKTDSPANPIEQVAAWLYRAARNQIINFGKKKREDELPYYQDDEGEIFNDLTEILFDADASAPSPETEYLRSLVWIELEKSLSELPPEQREVFEKTELEGLSVKEISEETGIPVNTLLSRKHYAILHLRRNLKELYFDIIQFPE
ncbi:Sigma-24 [Bacteroidales bacterium Barb6]|nr:Sigma-24 [Bacteroidales bacterium Barb6]OAV68168.1 Sigma-24 [Bacteroidales bacterium Barb6XT]OAV75373.1 Sigma-24 [Bacteroidales bacterium Barb7]